MKSWRCSCFRTSVLTLNLWGTNEPYNARMIQLKKFLHESRPGVLTFQEVSRVDGIPQVQDVIDALGYQCFYVNTGTTTSSGSDGLATCTLGEIFDHRTVELPIREGDCPRSGQVVTVRDGAAEFTVVNTHLSYNPDDQEIRYTQIGELLAAVSPIDLPLIFCGDLNEIPTGRAVSEVASNIEVRLTDAWVVGGGTPVGATFHPENELLDASIRDPRRYDYVFVSSHIAVQQCDVVLTGKGGLGPVSDHYGVLADLVIPTAWQGGDWR